jgi:UDP-glucose 4-epimerase
MKILVTGGAGYIGSVTVRELVKAGHTVTIFDNLQYGHEESVPDGVDFIRGDLTDRDVIDRLFAEKGFDAVIHFAANSLAGDSYKNPSKYLITNTIAAGNLLDTMVSHNVKYIVFSSSCSIYGTPDTLPVTEDEPTKPESPYGESKLYIEKVLNWYDKCHGIKSVSLRYFNASGAVTDGSLGESHDPETHLIPIIMQAALGQRDTVQLFGTDYETDDGTAVRDYIHVLDLADAHIKALSYLQKENSTNAFNLGVGTGYSVKQVIDMVKEVTGKDLTVTESARRKGDPAKVWGDPRKAKEVLGWNPEHSDLRTIVETAWKWHNGHPNGFEE